MSVGTAGFQSKMMRYPLNAPAANAALVGGTTARPSLARQRQLWRLALLNPSQPRQLPQLTLWHALGSPRPQGCTNSPQRPSLLLSRTTSPSYRCATTLNTTLRAARPINVASDSTPLRSNTLVALESEALNHGDHPTLTIRIVLSTIPSRSSLSPAPSPSPQPNPKTALPNLESPSTPTFRGYYTYMQIHTLCRKMAKNNHQN